MEPFGGKVSKSSRFEGTGRQRPNSGEKLILLDRRNSSYEGLMTGEQSPGDIGKHGGTAPT